MYRNIVWCYVFVLTLLDISLKTKLTAQGKSHGVTVHDSLIEGITFQEWGKESVGAGAESGGGGALPAGAVRVSPPALRFGRAALGAAHALAVTLTNTANTTLYLASVAGTTPDFHASFFESKKLPPQGNTSFSVVYLGRREGPVAAHLYIQTSLGVLKYPVSATGVPSEYALWPLAGVRVPPNVTLDALLTMHNPTDTAIQVQEVYSSASWLGLELPHGGASAPRALWSLPPHSTRVLVRLRLALPDAPAAHAAPPVVPPAAHADTFDDQPLVAYIRIKANVSGAPLVVGVSAARGAGGEYARPLQLRPGTRGSGDAPAQFSVSLGNSLSAGVGVSGGVWGAACARGPHAPRPPPAPPAPPTHLAPHPDANGAPAAMHNGAELESAPSAPSASEGVRVALLRERLAPRQEPAPAAVLTLNYQKLWSEFESNVGDVGGGAEAEAWCAGWLRMGRATLPYSLRLLPGTLTLLPDVIDFVTTNKEEARREREVRVRNHFRVPVRVHAVEYGPGADRYFDTVELSPLTVASGATATVAKIKLKEDIPSEPLNATLFVRTNVTEYTAPLRVYSGKLYIEWDWPTWSEGEQLELGAVGTSSTRRVGARLRNAGPATLCARELHADLPGAQLALAACEHLPDVPPDHDCRCVPGGAWAPAWLTVVAPAREGALRGAVWLRTAHARSAAAVSLRAHSGRLHAHRLRIESAAPYARSSSALVVESSMALPMRLRNVTQPHADPALAYLPPPSTSSWDIERGTTTLGSVIYAPEHVCAPNCYTGLNISSPEGAAWLQRCVAPNRTALEEDIRLLNRRIQMYEKVKHDTRNITLYLHTTQVVQIPVRGSVRWWWRRVCARAPPAAVLAPVAGTAPLRLRVRNPAAAHPLLLQPLLADRLPLHPLAQDEPAWCRNEECEWSADAFNLSSWRVRRGAATEWPHAGSAPLLLLQPDAELEFTFTFAPKKPLQLYTYLYLRNNLTIIEGIQLAGRGAYPRFELDGREPGGALRPFEVTACGGEAGGILRRALVARNTGRVPVRLYRWSVAGRECEARGFRLEPCAPLALAPNESRRLELAFSPDYTMTRVRAPLRLRTDLGPVEFTLGAFTPAGVLLQCAPDAPRPPFEPPLRALGALLALVAFALVIAAAALDAERLLRRARAARALAAPPRAPLDLRGVAREAPAPLPRVLPPPAPRRRRSARRPPPALDPHAERRAFDHWRVEMLRRDIGPGAEDDSSRSSEDADTSPPSTTSDLIVAAPSESYVPHTDDITPSPDGYETEPDAEEQPRTSGDEDAVSTGTESSSRDEPDRDDVDPPPDTPDDATHTNDNAIATETVKSAPPPDSRTKTPRPRRETDEMSRRSDRSRPNADQSESTASRGRSAPGKHHTRKDKGSKRRSERPTSTTARSSPPQSGEGRASGAAAGGTGGGSGGGAVPGAVRWGASWSSVVAARGAGPLPPIGSDVRRRTEPEPRAPPADNSLFYFNGEPPRPRPEAEFAWRAHRHDPRMPFIATNSNDYLEDPSALVNSAYGGGAGAMWDGWTWGVRPPPGFAPRAPVRAFDPFHSLAAIWAPGAPGALDWAALDRAPQHAPQHAPHAHARDDDSTTGGNGN